MRIKITADSTCDLSEELLAQWDIALMPMHILMGEDSYLDGVTIHPADVFAYVNAGGKMPKSAAANLVEYTSRLRPRSLYVSALTGLTALFSAAAACDAAEPELAAKTPVGARDASMHIVVSIASHLFLRSIPFSFPVTSFL